MGALSSPMAKNPRPTGTWCGEASRARNAPAAPNWIMPIARTGDLPAPRWPATVAPTISPMAVADSKTPSAAAPAGSSFLASQGAVTISIPSATLNAMKATVVATIA
jgi:hypothetical protein